MKLDTTTIHCFRIKDYDPSKIHDLTMLDSYEITEDEVRYMYGMTNDLANVKIIAKHNNLDIQIIDEADYHAKRGRILNWYSLKVEPKKELALVRYLNNCKIHDKCYEKIGEVYMPTVETMRTVSGRKKIMIQPLIPRYILVQSADIMHITKLLLTSDIKASIQGIVPQKEVDEFKAKSNVKKHYHDDVLVVGDSVTIHAFPFEGLSGIIVSRIEPEDGGIAQLKVSVSMLNRKVSIPISADKVRKDRIELI